jgi:hypothetical protein
MAKKPYSRELHDPLENDAGFDFDPDAISDLEFSEPAGDIFGDPAARELIERLKPSQMIPDRFQPRPILPESIHMKYHNGDIDCYQAAKRWISLGKTDKAHKARVDELIALADTVEDHGQIKPITGHWVPAKDGEFVFKIETGERRFWGVCLKFVADGKKEEPELRVENVDKPSVERQIIENRHAENPSAVAQAREIASLILNKLGIVPGDEIEDTYDYFRRALNPKGRKRLPKGFWNEIEPIMQLGQRRMNQTLSVLELPTSLLERADVNDLSSRVLSAILSAPNEDRARLMNKAISEGLSGDEVLELTYQSGGIVERTTAKKATKKNPSKSAMRGLRGFSNAFVKVSASRREKILDELANNIVVSGNAQEYVNLLEELMSLIKARISRN